MHKDKPPGIFEFAHRSVGHAVGLGLASGALLSIIAHLGFLIWRADAGTSEPPLAGADAAATVMSKHKPPPADPTPAPTPAVGY